MINPEAKDEIMELEPRDWHLINLVASEISVLVLYPNNIDMVRYLRDVKKCKVTIMARSIVLSEEASRAGIKFIMGDPIDSRIEPSSYDLIIADDAIFYYLDIELIMAACLEAANHLLIKMHNISTWKNRIHFLLHGRLSYPDGEFWHTTGLLRQCSIREFMEMCLMNRIIIERGVYYNKNGEMCNIYDLKRIPSLFADEIFFILSRTNTNSSNLVIN